MRDRISVFKGQKEIADIRKFIRRPPFETNFLELDGIALEVVEAYKNVARWAKPEGVPFDFRFFAMRPTIIKQPKGVALIIGPFNVSCRSRRGRASPHITAHLTLV